MDVRFSTCRITGLGEFDSHTACVQHVNIVLLDKASGDMPPPRWSSHVSHGLKARLASVSRSKANDAPLACFMLIALPFGSVGGWSAVGVPGTTLRCPARN